jgi:hypothetical protein
VAQPIESFGDLAGAGTSLGREVLATGLGRLGEPIGQLGGGLLQLLELKLEPLARGGNIGDAAAGPGERFELALVGVIQVRPQLMSWPVNRDHQGRPQAGPPSRRRSSAPSTRSATAGSLSRSSASHASTSGTTRIR